MAGGVAFVLLAAFLVPWHPVPGGALSVPPADSVFTADQVARAEAFARWARFWSWTSIAVSLVVACALGFTRLGRRVTDRLRGPWWLRVLVAVAVVDLLGRLFTLPLAIGGWRHRLDYGLSTQSWAGFLRDLATGELVTIVSVTLVLLVIIGSARRWQRAWPAVAAAVLGALVLAGSFVYPVVVEPLFNSFTPLPDGSLRTDILRLADQEGVRVDDVLVADASRRTTTLNAYVSGFGSTRRVVVYDNLVEALPRDEALSVVAHELAHARHDDVLVGSALGVAGAVFGVGVLGLLLVGLDRRRGSGVRDAAVVPRVWALLAIATLLASPVQNTISRQIETRADVDALRATGDAQAFIAMQKQLALRSSSDPTPPAWSQFWFGSHPTSLQRVALAERLAHRLDERPGEGQAR